MRLRITITFFSLLIAASGRAHFAPDTLWTRTYGGIVDDQANSIQQTSDGGYVVVGTTNSFGGTGNIDFYVVKTDAQGDTLWTRTYGGSGSDYAFSIHETSDGGYVLAGFTTSFGAGSADSYVVKTDAAGNPQWTCTYGGTNSDVTHSIVQTVDGGYVLAGYTQSLGAGSADFYVVKTNAVGDMLWTRTYGGSGFDYAYSIQQTIDGGYVVTGIIHSVSMGHDDFYVVKTDAQGDMLWTRTYGGSGNDQAHSVQQTTDGGYVVAGTTESFGAGSIDFYVVKTDAQGDTLWTRTYGGSGFDYAYSIQQTADGGYVVAGFTDSFGAGAEDFYVVKTDGQGDTLWTRTYGGSSYDVANSIQQTAYGGYVIAGFTGSFGAGGYDFYVVKTGGVRVLSPNGGETSHISQVDTTRWISFEYSAPVSVSLNRHYPYGEWETITDSTENDGEYEWLVTDPLSDSCRIRVCAVEDTFCDISDGNFSIVSSQGYLALIDPVQPNVPLLVWNAGTVECPETRSRTFYLKNFGSETITYFRPHDPPTPAFLRVSNCFLNQTLLPGQISGCSLTVTFDPVSDGAVLDTIFIPTNAVNAVGGYVGIALSGEQISTPNQPQVVIQPQSANARLSWNPITESIGDCSVNVTRYLVFFAGDAVGPYWFLAAPVDTFYTHYDVITYSDGMFYEVMAITGSAGLEFTPLPPR